MIQPGKQFLLLGAHGRSFFTFEMLKTRPISIRSTEGRVISNKVCFYAYYFGCLHVENE